MVGSGHRYMGWSKKKGAHLFFRSEVVHDVKELANLFRGLTLDHIRDGLAANIAKPPSIRKPQQVRKETRCLQKRLDIHVVGSEDNLKKHLLINSDELLVPFTDVRCAFASLILVGLVICSRQRFTAMVLAVLKDLRKWWHVNDSC